MKLFIHLKNVFKHRWYVFINCCKCGIFWQGLVHDLSKFSLAEFIPAIKYATGKKSPHETEIEIKGYSSAWLHHQGHNKHHPEYWLDYTHFDTPRQMPKKYVIEMFCDRLAASMIYKGKDFKSYDPLNYTKSKENKEKQLMHPETYKQLVWLQTAYTADRDGYIFAFIRDWLHDRKEITYEVQHEEIS